MAKKKITEAVREMASEFLEENGYELYSCEFVKEGRDWFLRVFIDLAQGGGAPDTEPAQGSGASDTEAASGGAEAKYIGTEDCEKVSRFLSEKLDEEDPIEQNYYLEVSSPGMDRPLITPEHYTRYIGREVEMKLYKAENGKKEINGVLADFAPCEGDYIVKVKDAEGTTHEFMLSRIARTRLAVIF